MATSIPVLVQSLTSYYVSRNNGFNFSTKFVYKTLFKLYIRVRTRRPPEMGWVLKDSQGVITFQQR